MPLCPAKGASDDLVSLEARRINRISAGLLVIGLGAAAYLHFRPPSEAADPLGNLLRQKKHMHGLRVMGGTANVTMAEFQAWFAGLWRGRALAGTVAVLTVLLTLAFRFVARHAELFRPDVPLEAAPPERVAPPGRQDGA